ncbi:MAG: hypothetical protein IKB78_06190 [Clostridia bacterium]|nr:hypothetical protein [Clostridia bacterium]
MKRLLACILALICLAGVAGAEALDRNTLFEFYEDSVFFGDSVMHDFRRYRSGIRQKDESFLPDVDMICTTSISLYEGSRRYVSDDHYFQFRGVKSSMYKLAKMVKPSKVFVLLGMNDPVGVRIDNSLIYIQDIIDGMKEFVPEAKVYFFSMTPITPRYCLQRKRPEYQEQLNEYNRRLKALCEEQGVGYIEIAEPLKDADGYLNMEYSSDEVCHLNSAGMDVWVQAMCDYAQEQYELDQWIPRAELFKVREETPEGD